MTRLMTRPVTRLAWLLALMVAAVALPAHAQGSYPNQPIRFIVPYAAGGLPDSVARIVAQRLGDRLGQSIVVENRPGGNGSVAATTLTGAPADGYTFLVTDASMITINPLVFKTTYNAKADFTPVALLARAPLFLATHPNLPVRSLKDFIEHVRANPGKVNYGSSGVGSTHHLTMEAMKAALKLQMTHVPYRGTGQSVPALLGGHVQVLFSAYPSLVGAVAEKKLNLLATNGAQRSPQAPDVPPIADVIPGFDFAVMVGILARAGTPAAVIEKVAAEAVKVAQSPEVAKQYAAVGIEQATAGSAEFGKALKDETDRVTKVVETAGIKLE